MEELKKPFFIAALVLFGLVVLIELGAHFFVPHPSPDQIATAMCASDSKPPECFLPNGVQLLANKISANQEPARPRSEERRVGKEGRSRGAPDDVRKN